MAGLAKTFAHTVPRIEHVGSVVTSPALLDQRRAERAERLRLAKAAGATIAGALREHAAGDEAP